MIWDGVDCEGGGCWLENRSEVGGEGGEEHTTHPNDLYPPPRWTWTRFCSDYSTKVHGYDLQNQGSVVGRDDSLLHKSGKS